MGQFVWHAIAKSCTFASRHVGELINILSKRTAVTLAYKINGECSPQTTPLLVLHGLLGSKRNWEGMSKKLAEALNTCAVVADARNHGESPHDPSHTYLDLAADASQLIQTLKFKRCSIIGHSMGGRTAMALALTEPDIIDRLVIVDISPVTSVGVQNDFFPRLIKVMKSINFDGISNLSQARSLAKDKILESGVIKQMEGMNFLLLNLAVKQNKTVGWVFNLDALQQHFHYIASFPEELATKKFYGSTLFIGGEKSNYIPPTDLDGIKSFFPNAELKYVPGVGHNVHVEDPNKFFDLCKEFLKR